MVMPLILGGLLIFVMFLCARRDKAGGRRDSYNGGAYVGGSIEFGPGHLGGDGDGGGGGGGGDGGGGE